MHGAHGARSAEELPRNPFSVLRLVAGRTVERERESTKMSISAWKGDAAVWLFASGHSISQLAGE